MTSYYVASYDVVSNIKLSAGPTPVAIVTNACAVHRARAHAEALARAPREPLHAAAALGGTWRAGAGAAAARGPPQQHHSERHEDAAREAVHGDGSPP